VGVEMSPVVYWENAFEVNLLTARHEENGMEISHMNSGYDMTFRSRYIHDISRSASIIPFTVLSAISLDVLNSDSADTLNLHGLKWVGGIGVNHDMGEASIMMAEFYFEAASTSYIHRETDDKSSTFETVYYTLPGIRLGLETPLFSWMDLRMGFKKSIGYIRSEYPAAEENNPTGMVVDRMEEQPFDATLGLGVKMREMELDITSYPMEWFGSIGTGTEISSSANNMILQASLTYRF